MKSKSPSLGLCDWVIYMIEKVENIIKNLKSLPFDICKIIHHRNHINYNNLPKYIKYQYFREEWEGEKIESMVYYNFINYHLYRNEYIFERLKTYWKKYRHYNITLKKIKENFKCQKKLNILDIGCGFTSILNILDFGNKYGIDIGLVELSKKGFDLDDQIHWISGDGEELPLNSDSFDVIFSTNSLDHMPNTEKCIEEIKRVLKEGGLFVLIVDVFEKECGFRNMKHPNSFTKENIIQMLDEFKMIEITTDKQRVGVSKYINSTSKDNHESEKISNDDDRNQLFLICSKNQEK